MFFQDTRAPRINENVFKNMFGIRVNIHLEKTSQNFATIVQNLSKREANIANQMIKISMRKKVVKQKNKSREKGGQNGLPGAPAIIE